MSVISEAWSADEVWENTSPGIFIAADSGTHPFVFGIELRAVDSLQPAAGTTSHCSLGLAYLNSSSPTY
jgi:hypothetical protein